VNLHWRRKHLIQLYITSNLCFLIVASERQLYWQGKLKEKSIGTANNLLYIFQTFTRQIWVSQDIKHIKTIAVTCSSHHHREDLLKHLKMSSLTYDKAHIHFTEWCILSLISQIHSTVSQYSKITYVWPTEFQYKSSLQRAYDHSHTTVSQYRFLLLKAQPIILQETAKVNKYGKTEESETKILGVTGTYLLYKEKKYISTRYKWKGKIPPKDCKEQLVKNPLRLQEAACLKSPLRRKEKIS